MFSLLKEYFLKHPFLHIFLGERYVTSTLGHKPPVCGLSSVILLHPAERFELFGSVFVPSNSSRTRSVCIKILEIN